MKLRPRDRVKINLSDEDLCSMLVDYCVDTYRSFRCRNLVDRPRIERFELMSCYYLINLPPAQRFLNRKLVEVV